MAEKKPEEFTPMLEEELTEEELAIKKRKEEEELEKAWLQGAEQEAVGTLVDDILLDEHKADEEEPEVPGVGNIDNAFNPEGKTAESMDSEEVFKLYLQIAQEEGSQIANVDHDPASKIVTVEMDSGTKLVDTGDLIGVDAPKGTKPSDKDIETLVRGVKLRNWRGMQLEGSEEFKARVWLEAQRQGVRPIGYSPPAEVRALWEAEKPTRNVEQQQTEQQEELNQVKDTQKEEAEKEAEKPKEESTTVQTDEKEHETVHIDVEPSPVVLLPEKAESLQKAPKQLKEGIKPPKQLKEGVKQDAIAIKNDKLEETSKVDDASMKQFKDCMTRSFEGKPTNKDKVFIKEFLSDVEKMPEKAKEDTQSKMRDTVKKLMKDNGASYHGDETEQQNTVIQQSMLLLQNTLKEKPENLKAKTQEKAKEQSKVNLALKAAKHNQRGG